MADNELLIKINADAKNAVKAFDDIRAQTEDLDSVLKDTAAISAVAFAVLTAEVGFAVHAFTEAESASRLLSQALQNQGIFTKELADSYKEYAAVVEEKTGIDDDSIVKAQAVAQGYLGQTKITQDLTFAIANLAEKQGGDLNSAAEILGRTIGTGTNALARQGLQLSETASQAERMAKVLEFVNTKAGGFAEAANQGELGIRGLKTAFGNLQEEIGSRFAPIIETAISVTTKLFRFLKDSPEIVNATVAFIAAGVAITGLATVIPAAIVAFGALKAAMTAMGVAATAGQIAIKALVGATGIGLLVIVGVEIALHWKTIWGTIQSIVQAATQNIQAVLLGLGQVLSGVFNFNGDQIKAGLAQVKVALIEAKNDFIQIRNEENEASKESGEVQNKERKAAADKAAAIERQKQANLRAIREAELELVLQQTNHSSQAAIELKTKEIAILKALNEQKSQDEKNLLLQQHEEIVALQEEQRAEDYEKAEVFQQELTASKLQIEQDGHSQVVALRQQQSAELQASLLTEAEAERKVLFDKTKENIDARNKELIDRKKHGEAVATINKFLNSEEVQGVKTATGELVALQNSRNSTLKGIGKAAAVAQITIKTAESAINIYNGFSTIPIIGPALGIAGAAAAVAYGAEQIGRVTGAADGGLIEGGIPGKDSVPAFLEPGELVVPRRNFADVVGAVQGGGGGFSDEALALLQSIDSKTGTAPTTIIQGDVMADDSYIDALTRKISDAVELRNAKIFGLNT